MPNGYPSSGDIQQAFVEVIKLYGGSELYLFEVYDPLASHFNLSLDQRLATRAEVVGHGEERSYWQNLVRTAKARLTDKGILEAGLGHGLCRLTTRPGT